MVISSYLMRVLQEQVVGQESAVAAVSRAVTLALAGGCRNNRPLAVLLFAGPFGSGKIHVAQSLAYTLLGNACKLIYVNCQQLSEAADPLLNLHEQLATGYWYACATPPFWPSAFSIVVFEEIDKAPISFRDRLAAAIDRGELRSYGSFFSLRNTFIILTIHLSRKKADQLIGRPLGFSVEGETDVEMAGHHIMALEETDNMLGIDLVNHIDEIVIFERLTERYILMLLDRRLTEIERFLAGSSIGFIISPEAKSFLLKIGLGDLTHGMRQLNRGVRNYLEFPLADLMLSGRLSPGTIVEVKYEPPRAFLHFQILIPKFVLPQMSLVKNQMR